MTLFLVPVSLELPALYSIIMCVKIYIFYFLMETSMHTLFESIPSYKRGITRVPEFLYVKGGIARDLAKALKKHHEYVTAVNSGHFLIRLIQSMNVSMERDYRNYADVALDRGEDLSRSLQMTSPMSVGKVFTDGIFYSKNVEEIIISNDSDFDVDEAVRRWRELEPIRVLRHPFDDINLKVPYGDYDDKITGVAVIAINIPMLMIQYRRWFETEKKVNEEADRTINQFVSMYPIPNMLRSHLDIALFNRINTIYLDEEPERFKRENVFFTSDFTSKLDRIIDKQITILRNKHYEFDQILLSIPAITKESLFEVVSLPTMARTRQVNWALTMSRLPYIKFLLRLNKESDNENNRFYLNRIRIALKTIKNDRTLKQALPRNLLKEVEEGLKTEISVYL